MDINILNIHLLLEMHYGSAVTLFGTILIEDIEQNHAVIVYWFVVLNKYILHLQTPLIIIKSGHSPYRDLWAHRKWEHVSEFSRLKSRVWYRLNSAPLLSIFPIIDIGHFQTRFADNFFFFIIMQTNILFTGDIIYWWINNTGEII